MVSLVPATFAGTVRTVAATAAGLAEGVLLAVEPPADAAVTAPTAATAARPIPAMMILGCRMLAPGCLTIHYLLTRIVEMRGSPSGRGIVAAAQATGRHAAC